MMMTMTSERESGWLEGWLALESASGCQYYCQHCQLKLGPGDDDDDGGDYNDDWNTIEDDANTIANTVNWDLVMMMIAVVIIMMNGILLPTLKTEIDFGFGILFWC